MQWHSNANITWLLVLWLKNIWWFSSWISTVVQHSLLIYGSDKCHLILETEVDYLQLVGSCCEGFCMCTSITGLCGAYFFLCVRGILCSGQWNSTQQSFKMCASEIESESLCVLVALLCEKWAVCLCLTAAFEQFSLVLFENNGWFLLFGLCGNMMLLARKVCVLEQ